MKKALSIFCAVTLIISVLIVPLAMTSLAEAESPEVGKEVDLTPSDLFGYEQRTDDNGVYYEKATGDDHAMVFDYQIESGYDYYLIYDYKGPATGNYGGWLQGIAATVFPNKKAAGNTGYNGNAIQLNEPESSDSWSAGNIEILNGDKLLGSKEGGTYLAITSSYVDNHAFRNLKIVKKKADNTIIPSAFTSMKVGCENGELYWQSTTTDQYSFTGFATNYELKTNQKYMVTFDVKKPDGAFNYAGFYASADYSKCDVWMDLSQSQLPYASFTDFGSSEWTPKTYILDTAAVENLVTDANKYFSFGANIAWTNGTTLAFKNLTVQELDDTSLTLNNFGGFQTFIEDGKLVSKYNRTSGSDEYSLLGFATSFKVEAGKKYVVDFEFKKEESTGLNLPLAITTYSAPNSGDPSGTRVIFNQNETNVWTEKTVLFSTDDTAKTYLGVYAKTYPTSNYNISFKNFNVYDLGDVNFDGSIGSDDLICLRKELLGIENTGARFTNINADEAGETNIIDLVALKKLIAANSTNS